MHEAAPPDLVEEEGGVAADMEEEGGAAAEMDDEGMDSNALGDGQAAAVEQEQHD